MKQFDGVAGRVPTDFPSLHDNWKRLLLHRQFEGKISMKSEINRIDIRVQSDLKPNQYCLLDYLLFRSNLDRWGFNFTNIENQTALSRGTAHRTLKQLEKLGWVGQDAENHYVFHRQVFLEWMQAKVEQSEQRSKMERPIPKWNGQRSKVERTNRKVQIRSTNKSTANNNNSTCTFQNETPASQPPVNRKMREQEIEKAFPNIFPEGYVPPPKKTLAEQFEEFFPNHSGQAAPEAIEKSPAVSGTAPEPLGKESLSISGQPASKRPGHGHQTTPNGCNVAPRTGQQHPFSVHDRP